MSGLPNSGVTKNKTTVIRKHKGKPMSLLLVHVFLSVIVFSSTKSAKLKKNAKILKNNKKYMYYGKVLRKRFHFNRMFSPDIMLVNETQDFSLTFLTFFCSIHHHDRCAFFFKILRECFKISYS